MAGRWPVARADLTAQELAASLPGGDFPILPERVVAIASRSEGVAFARAPIANEEAQRLGNEAIAIVEDLETVWRARTAQQAIAQKSAGKRIKRKPLS